MSISPQNARIPYVQSKKISVDFHISTKLYIESVTNTQLKTCQKAYVVIFHKLQRSKGPLLAVPINGLLIPLPPLLSPG